MDINKENYQAYFLDYHEGNLDAVQTAELLLFLENNPELKSEFESFEKIDFEIESVLFEGKQSLKKNKKDEVYRLLIAELEGYINVDEKKQLSKIESKTSLETERKLFASTKLIADLSVQLPGKAFLKRQERKPVVLRMYYQFAAAAAIVLMLGVYFFLESRNDESISNTNSIATVIQPSNSSKTIIEPVVDPNKNVAVVLKKPQMSSEEIHTPTSRPKTQNPILKTNNEQSIANNEPQISQSTPEIIKQETPNVQEEQVAQVVTPKEEIVASINVQEEFQKQFPEAKVSDINTEPKSPSLFWQISSALTKTLNKKSKNKVELSPIVDPSGESSGFTFAAGNFRFERVNAK